MEHPENRLEALLKQLEDYSKSSLQLIKLKTLDSISDIIVSLVYQLVLYITILFFGLVVTIGIALFLGEWLGKMYYGFLLVSLFYFIVGVILYLFLHRWLKKPIIELILKKMQ